MKTVSSIRQNAMEMEDIMAVCCGVPQGDELPQVAGVQDILIDVYSDMLNMPREIAAGRFHHQYEDDFTDIDMIH